MEQQITQHSALYGSRMRQHIETALRAAFTRAEFEQLVQASGLERVRISEPDEHHFILERTGESDPNSWIKAREQYL
jgi:hypothetical protein